MVVGECLPERKRGEVTSRRVAVGESTVLRSSKLTAVAVYCLKRCIGGSGAKVPESSDGC